MERKSAQEFDQELLYLYDYYVHGQIDRRTFLERAAKFAVGGVTALALLEMLNPHYAFAAQVPKEDARVLTRYEKFSSPAGHGECRGLLAKPAGAKGKLPGVIVIHENRGLNPDIEDVARRVALAGFVAFAVGTATIVRFGGVREDSFAIATIAGAVGVIFTTGLLMLISYVAVLKLLRVPEIDTAFSGIAGILRR